MDDGCVTVTTSVRSTMFARRRVTIWTRSMAALRCSDRRRCPCACTVYYWTSVEHVFSRGVRGGRVCESQFGWVHGIPGSPRPSPMCNARRSAYPFFLCFNDRTRVPSVQVVEHRWLTITMVIVVVDGELVSIREDSWTCRERKRKQKSHLASNCCVYTIIWRCTAVIRESKRFLAVSGKGRTILLLL